MGIASHGYWMGIFFCTCVYWKKIWQGQICIVWSFGKASWPSLLLFRTFEAVKFAFFRTQIVSDILYFFTCNYWHFRAENNLSRSYTERMQLKRNFWLTGLYNCESHSRCSNKIERNSLGLCYRWTQLKEKRRDAFVNLQMMGRTVCWNVWCLWLNVIACLLHVSVDVFCYTQSHPPQLLRVDPNSSHSISSTFPQINWFVRTKKILGFICFSTVCQIYLLPKVSQTVCIRAAHRPGNQQEPTPSVVPCGPQETTTFYTFPQLPRFPFRLVWNTFVFLEFFVAQKT